jgi:aldose 1-epimerase
LKTKNNPYCFVFIFLIHFLCAQKDQQSKLTSQPFGKTPEGKEVFLYTLCNNNGMKVDITNYGAIVVRLFIPDKQGKLADVVLGYNTLTQYVADSPYFGCIVGRFGNRIAHGRFSLDGKEYQLATNNEPGGIPCHLHGGLKGFDKRVWEAKPVSDPEKPGIEMRYLSKDGEEGYPGNLDVTVCYRLSDKNELIIEYMAKTDKATSVNLTQHSYFNLKGEGNGDILDHILMIQADHFTPVNKGLIPTGVIQSVTDTPFDFTSPHAIGEFINAKDEQIQFGGGYDHNWVLRKKENELTLAATVYEPNSGRFMEVWTTEPGLQFYSGNFLDGHIIGKSAKPYHYRSGLCLETQHFPDSPNQPNFPSVILRPTKQYKSTTLYRFSTK